MLKDFSYNNETIETVNEGDSSNILVDVDNSNIVFDNTVSSIQQNRHSRCNIFLSFEKSHVYQRKLHQSEWGQVKGAKVQNIRWGEIRAQFVISSEL